MSGQKESLVEFPLYTLEWLGRCTEMANAAVRRFNEDFVLVDRIIAKNKKEFKTESDAQCYVKKIVRAFVESVSRTTENLTDLNVEIIRELHKRHPSLSWPYDRKDNDRLLQKISQNKPSIGNGVREKEINAVKSRTEESLQNVKSMQTKTFSLRLVRCDSTNWSEKRNMAGTCNPNIDDQVSGPSKLSQSSPRQLGRASDKKRVFENFSDSLDSDNDATSGLLKKRILQTPKDSALMSSTQVHADSGPVVRRNKNEIPLCHERNVDHYEDCLNYKHQKKKPGVSAVASATEKEIPLESTDRNTSLWAENRKTGQSVNRSIQKRGPTKI